MEILIPTLSEIEEVIERCLTKHLSSIIGTNSASAKIHNDRIGLKEAKEITGLKESALYKMTMKGSIPHKKFQKRLVFSRNDLETWMAERTVPKHSAEEIVSQQLVNAARKKLNKY